MISTDQDNSSGRFFTQRQTPERLFSSRQPIFTSEPTQSGPIQSDEMDFEIMEGESQQQMIAKDEDRLEELR